MSLPRDSSDIAVCFACQACNGNGGYGRRSLDYVGGELNPANFKPCTSCNGTGWTSKRPNEPTPAELTRLHKRLPSFEKPSATKDDVKPPIITAEDARQRLNEMNGTATSPPHAPEIPDT
jgi:hypothetical protein